MKICKQDTCTFPVFSNGYCKYHQFLREDMKKKFISPISKKRKVQQDKYASSILAPDIDNKEIRICFFCGKAISGVISHHHLLGRDGDKLNDKSLIVSSHNKCHVEHYHSLPIEKLIELGWYDDFLNRLKSIQFFLFEKELLKQVKSNIIDYGEYLKKIGI